LLLHGKAGGVHQAERAFRRGVNRWGRRGVLAGKPLGKTERDAVIPKRFVEGGRGAKRRTAKKNINRGKIGGGE